MKPTLLVLAAGMGSRYGALKQMDGVGPNNEAILDYSIFDAKRAGFGKVVFVIREDFAEAFKKVNNEEKYGIPVEYVYQSLDKLPEGFSVPEGRVKPWGTCHAVLMAKDVIHDVITVTPVFTDSTHNAKSACHAQVRPRVVLISGAAVQTGEYTFRYDPDYFGFDPKRLWDGITLCIEADGDGEYKSAVQELNIQIKR